MPFRPEYATPGLGFPHDIADMNAGGDLPEPTISEWDRSSRVASTLVRTFSRAFVIVDRTRMQGVTLEQLADYVGMGLFDGAPEAAPPPGMTDWDQAFLKSLYSTEQQSKVQRALIAKDMVREIIH